MCKEVSKFRDIEIWKNNFLKKDVDIDKVLASNKFFFGEKNLKVLYWLLA